MDLLGFEAAVYRRQHNDALNRLLAILRALATGKALVDDAERDDARSPATVLHTRLAAAIAGLFADPQLKLVIEEIRALNPDVIIPMHCSGDNFARAVRETMPDKLIQPSTGARLTFGA